MEVVVNGEKIILTQELALKVFQAVQMEQDRAYIVNDLIGLYKNDPGFSQQMLMDLNFNKEISDPVIKRYRKRLDQSYGTKLQWDCLREAYAYIKTLSR